MSTALTHDPLPRTVDLTGLPESVAQDIEQLVHTLRDKFAPPAVPRTRPLAGRLAHLGLSTPTLEEFEEARREAWANFPRDFPDPVGDE